MTAQKNEILIQAEELGLRGDPFFEDCYSQYLTQTAAEEAAAAQLAELANSGIPVFDPAYTKAATVEKMMSSASQQTIRAITQIFEVARKKAATAGKAAVDPIVAALGGGE